MNLLSTYIIQIRGQINVEELNPMSPHHMTVLESPASDTLLSIQTDQSGMIGMLAHLHNLGLIVLSVQWTTGPAGRSENSKE